MDLVGSVEKKSTIHQFQFVSIQNPDDRRVSRQARSHAVAWGIENKRKLQRKSGRNFHAACLRENPGHLSSKGSPKEALITPLHFVSPFTLPSPFQELAADSPRLQELLSHHQARQATQLALSVLDELVLPNFRSVLRNGFDDHALRSAVMLTFAFAATTGNIDRECLGYQSAAMSSIRQRMSSLDRASSESTLGAILLLAGIEAQLGMPRQVQLHLGAVQQLLDICRTRSVCLSHGIKRAIFWQDLNSSVMTGSNRIVDHTTFVELQWSRDPFSLDHFILPLGFQSHSHLLGEDLVEVLKDVHAMQCIRDLSQFGIDDVIAMANIDNHQASIQSRLVSVPIRSSIGECCRLATYLCSTMLRCKIWFASTVPPHLSFQLLCKLKQTNDNPDWDDRPELLLWLLHIGGAFAPKGTIRSDFLALLQSNRNTRLNGLHTSWPELHKILKQFIWSEKAFLSSVKEFWEESSARWR